jgi:hypothetical protein
MSIHCAGLGRRFSVEALLAAHTSFARNPAGRAGASTENLATMYPASTHHRMLDLNACAQDAAIGGLRH